MAEMSPCDSARILRYLENSLEGRELDDFRAHLKVCENCRASLAAERALSNALHRARPLYSAPDSLRARVAECVAEYSASARRQGLVREGVLQKLRRRLFLTRPQIVRPRILVFAIAILALCLAIVPNVVRQARAAGYVETAVAAHRSCVNGQLPLGFRSSSPELVTAWLTSNVQFRFRLPATQAPPDNALAYQLVGATTVNYRGRRAALVTYEKQNQKITLLVAPTEFAVVAGGDEIRSGALVFHYRSSEGFNVITWSTHGLSYALVSSVSGSARESCMVCHHNTADHLNFTTAN